MQRLEAAIAAIRAVRDCESVRRLCLDVWGWALAHGEDDGLMMARMLQKCVTEYQKCKPLA